MKKFNLKKIVFFLCALLISMSNFAQEKPTDGQNRTPQDAANKGKADLLEVLKSGRDLNLGVTAEQLANAKAGKPIAKIALDFNKLLNLENTQSLRETQGDVLNTVVPLLLDGKVVTVIEVKETANGWVVASLGGASLSNDLTTVLAASNNAEIVIYEVPNLQSTVYAAVINHEESYFTTMGEKQSLRTPLSRAVLFPALQAEAQAFQAEWGDKVKANKLVK